jgi:hypothetical protein
MSVIAERYERLGLIAHTGTRIKGRLLEKGLVGQESVRVPNGSVTLLKLTEQGLRLVGPRGEGSAGEREP